MYVLSCLFCHADLDQSSTVMTVERMWGGCKAMMRQQKSMHSRLFETYLQEFMWRKQFDREGEDPFMNIISHITAIYAV